MSKRKSLTDRINTPIRGAISAFTTQNTEINEENLNKDKEVNVPNNLTENETNINTELVTENKTINTTESNTTSVKEDITINNTNKETELETNNNTENESETNNVTKNETKTASKAIMSTKSIKVGSSVFKSTYYNDDDIKRAAYHLRQDTIDKIEKCSKLSGLKKAEFVDLVLNNILTDILNKIEK